MKCNLTPNKKMFSLLKYILVFAEREICRGGETYCIGEGTKVIKATISCNSASVG